MAVKIQTQQFDCFQVSAEDAEKLKQLPVGTALYTHPAPPPEVIQLIAILEGFASIINESNGVSGYHLNGAVACWDEFDEVNRLFEALAKHRGTK